MYSIDSVVHHSTGLGEISNLMFSNALCPPLLLCKFALSSRQCVSGVIVGSVYGDYESTILIGHFANFHEFMYN